jgi:hypothetical protein
VNPGTNKNISRMNVRLKPLNEQEELIYRLCWQEKLSPAEVAQRLGVTQKHVRTVYKETLVRLEDYARYGDESLLLLPLRARKFVQTYSFGDRATIGTAIETGGLWWNDRWKRICWEHKTLQHQAGWATWVVLHEWGRLPAPIPKKTKKCPHCGGDLGV